MTINRDLEAAIAATRFGLGARPGEITAAKSDPRGFLLEQIRASGADQPADTGAKSQSRLREELDVRQQRHIDKAAGRGKGEAAQAEYHRLKEEENADFFARAQLAARTPAAFRERWALFWANHFTVAGVKKHTKPLVAAFELEAIRPHVFGRFRDLLIASSQHPAMLYYLDQARSIGPDSPVAGLHAGGKSAGLNENLAREIMELHTLGVDAGYTQADVTEFARALTGWTVTRGDEQGVPVGSFLFRDNAHEPGPRTVFGRTYRQEGEAQGLAILDDLARDPHTAHHLAFKIARHFVADDPPATLVDALTRSYLASDGGLDAVARTLVTTPAAWRPEPLKFKTPYEFLVSSWRALDVTPDDEQELAATLTGMGQAPMRAPSPKGWPEEAQVWCAPDAIIKRMNWSDSFARARAARADALVVADNALGARLTPRASQSIAHAESRGEAIAILLMSPEFQRR